MTEATGNSYIKDHILGMYLLVILLTFIGLRVLGRGPMIPQHSSTSCSQKTNAGFYFHYKQPIFIYPDSSFISCKYLTCALQIFKVELQPKIVLFRIRECNLLYRQLLQFVFENSELSRKEIVVDGIGRLFGSRILGDSGDSIKRPRIF